MNRRQPPGISATNHLANPIVRQLLRGPAGHRLSRRLALICCPGRRTGCMYELPVQFARNGNRIWILPGSPERKTWWRNLRGGADLDLVLAGHDMHGHAMVIDPRQTEFAEGLAAYLHAAPRARRALGLPKQLVARLARVDLD